ncbi:hypothetical protein ACOSQ3_010291 [Xanthoceras sorbifolium]
MTSLTRQRPRLWKPSLKINPDSVKGYKSRGIAWAMIGQWKEVAKDLHLASTLDYDEEISVVLKKVLLPCCIDNYHWVLWKINLRKKMIVIYDSLQKYKDPKYRISQIEPLIKFLPSMLRCGGFFENTGIATWMDGIKVDILPLDKLPQQQDRSSCKAFVMKYMENIMTFKEFNWDFVKGDAKKIQKGIAMEIFAYSIPHFFGFFFSS